MLSGDRNISPDITLATPILYDNKTTPTKITKALGGIAATKVGWTKVTHVEAGDVLFGDGHVDQDSTGRLREALRDVFLNTGFDPITILFPNGNGTL